MKLKEKQICWELIVHHYWFRTLAALHFQIKWLLYLHQSVKIKIMRDLSLTFCFNTTKSKISHSCYLDGLPWFVTSISFTTCIMITQHQVFSMIWALQITITTILWVKKTRSTILECHKLLKGKFSSCKKSTLSNICCTSCKWAP